MHLRLDWNFLEMPVNFASLFWTCLSLPTPYPFRVIFSLYLRGLLIQAHLPQTICISGYWPEEGEWCWSGAQAIDQGDTQISVEKESESLPVELWPAKHSKYNNWEQVGCHWRRSTGPLPRTAFSIRHITPHIVCPLLIRLRPFRKSLAESKLVGKISKHYIFRLPLMVS